MLLEPDTVDHFMSRWCFTHTQELDWVERTPLLTL